MKKKKIPWWSGKKTKVKNHCHGEANSLGTGEKKQQKCRYPWWWEIWPKKKHKSQIPGSGKAQLGEILNRLILTSKQKNSWNISIFLSGWMNK